MPSEIGTCVEMHSEFTGTCVEIGDMKYAHELSINYPYFVFHKIQWHRRVCKKIFSELISMAHDLGPILLTWINFNPSIDVTILRKVWYEIIYPFPNLNGSTVEIWKLINNSISLSIMDVIMYFCQSTITNNVRIAIRISVKFVPKVPIDNKWALVRVMAWRRTGDI